MTLEPMDMQTQAEAPTQDIKPPNPDIVLQSTNIAKTLDDDVLAKIGEQCKRGYEMDLNSRSNWEADLDDWINLANQVREQKNFPWRNASNVKYPLLSTAAMQFAARAYPSLVPDNGQVVKSWVIGKDPTGEKLAKADRVSTYMSYQVMHQMENWNEEMDKMLMMLPIVGTMFKKTFYDRAQDKIVSNLVLPKNLVVNYWAKNLEDCERISEIIYMSKRVLKERQNQEIYLDIDLGEPQLPLTSNNEGNALDSETLPYTIIEQHTFCDLDDSGYPKPYIVTFDEGSGKVLRITNRFRKDDVVVDEKGKVLKIKPQQLYTKFGFIPNPDGSFYDIGFGVLLGPLNESVNTLINQLVDSGTLNNLQSGFIGKSLKLRAGDQSFDPGEWKPVNATGDDLRKQIVPLPTKEPSNVLFQLMGTLITSGKELASVAEIFVGKMPGQNTPATTTMASIEQGMKVFTAVYKRIFRSLAQEFNKIFELNALYTDPQTVVAVIDTEVGPEDFSKESYDICPGADPSAMSKTEKLTKAQGLVEALQIFGPIMNPVEVAIRVLEAQEQPNYQKLFSQQVLETGQVPPPPPDPKIMAIQAKMQADQQKVAIDAQAKQQEMELEARSHQQKMMMESQMHAQKMKQQQESDQVRAASEIQKARVNIATAQAQGQQKVVQNAQTHQQQMSQAKEKAKLSKTSNSKNGKARP